MDARLQQYDDKMKKAYDFLEADYATIRAGRANPHVLDKLRIDCALGEILNQGNREGNYDF